jgi:hypothetical protein
MKVLFCVLMSSISMIGVCQAEALLPLETPLFIVDVARKAHDLKHSSLQKIDLSDFKARSESDLVSQEQLQQKVCSAELMSKATGSYENFMQKKANNYNSMFAKEIEAVEKTDDFKICQDTFQSYQNLYQDILLTLSKTYSGKKVNYLQLEHQLNEFSALKLKNHYLSDETFNQFLTSIVVLKDYPLEDALFSRRVYANSKKRETIVANVQKIILNLSKLTSQDQIKTVIKILKQSDGVRRKFSSESFIELKVIMDIKTDKSKQFNLAFDRFHFIPLSSLLTKKIQRQTKGIISTIYNDFSQYQSQQESQIICRNDLLQDVIDQSLVQEKIIKDIGRETQLVKKIISEMIIENLNMLPNEKKALKKQLYSKNLLYAPTSDSGDALLKINSQLQTVYLHSLLWSDYCPKGDVCYDLRLRAIAFVEINEFLMQTIYDADFLPKWSNHTRLVWKSAVTSFLYKTFYKYEIYSTVRKNFPVNERFIKGDYRSLMAYFYQKALDGLYEKDHISLTLQQLSTDLSCLNFKAYENIELVKRRERQGFSDYFTFGLRFDANMFYSAPQSYYKDNSEFNSWFSDLNSATEELDALLFLNGRTPASLKLRPSSL